jgi:AraC-like DNA-binding protein
MEAIPLHRIAIVLPFARFLADVGAPVEQGFRQAGLPFEALGNVNNYVPSQRFWAFVGNMARSQGIEDLGFRVGQTYGADCADPHLSALLRQSPTLYHALVRASELVNKTISRSRIGLLQPPHGEHTYFYHRPSFDTHNPFIDQIDWFGLNALIGMVRVFAGPEWQPAEIGVTTHHAPCRSIREALPGTHIRPSQTYAYITLDNALLGLSPPPHEATAGASTILDCDSVSNDFVGSLKQVLRSYIPASDLGIEFAAELCNTSKRSLQRTLAENGTRYSEVLDQTHFDAASELLQDPDIKVTDVAHQLGYSDSAHFSRAFKRIAGVNPRVYRQAYSH